MQSGASYEVTHTIYISLVFGSLDSGSNFQVDQGGGFTATRVYPNLIINSAVDTNFGGNVTTTGNLVIAGPGTVRGTNNITARSHTIGGSIIINGGNFVGTDQTSNATFAIGGSLQLLSGTYSSGSGTGIPIFSFNGPNGVIDLMSAGTVNNSVHQFNINGVRTLTSDLPLTGQTLTVNGTLNFGIRAVTGSGNLTTGPASSLGIGSPGGIDAANAGGNIRLTGTRSYSASTTFVYNGTADQVAGSGLPAVVATLKIANTGGAGSNTVNGNASQTVTGLINIQAGRYAGSGTHKDVQIDAGAAYLAAGPISVGGTWTNEGLFSAKGFTVTLNGLGAQVIAGDTTFYGLTKTVTSSQTLSFEAGRTQTVTGQLTLNGSAGSLLLLRSTKTGSQWHLAASPAQSVAYVDVRDSDAGSGSGITPASSVNSGNNVNWLFTGSISGSVAYTIMPKPVPGVDLAAAGAVPVSGMTNAAGGYLLNGFGPGAYTVTPSRVAQPCEISNGVYASDASLIAQQVVGLVTFSAAQMAAAKVSGVHTQTLSSYDAALIAQKVVGVCSAQNLAGSWRFTPVTREHPNGVNSVLIENYDALMMGDVNGDWEPGGPLRPSDVPGKVPIVITLPLVNASSRMITIPVMATNLGTANRSYQFDVIYDHTVLRPADTLVGSSGTLSSGMSVASNSTAKGAIRIAVYSAVPIQDDGLLINLKFEIVGSAGSASPIRIRSARFDDGSVPVTAVDGTVTVVN
jgi:hypothetical protein